METQKTLNSQSIPQSFQDEALARWSTPREVQRSILKSETVLATLYAVSLGFSR